jgi:sodium/hydrogen antiporter
MFSYLMKSFYKQGFINRESYITQYIALALLVAGIVSTIGSDDLLAAFAAGVFRSFLWWSSGQFATGCAISWDGDFKIHVEGDVFWSIIDLALNSACFVYLGAWMPFGSFNSAALGITPWRLIVLLVAILFLRRIPALLVLYKWIPVINTWQEALFCGHFGDLSGFNPCSNANAWRQVLWAIATVFWKMSDFPAQMGVGAIFVSSLALQKLPIPHNPPENHVELLAATLQPIVSFVVLGSIIIRKIRDNPLQYRWQFCSRWPVPSFHYFCQTGSFTDTSNEL